MKYWFGAICILIGAWMVYRTLAHRRAVILARERAAAAQWEPRISRELRGLQSLRTGMAPLFVLLILFGGVVLTALWFMIDRQRILSPLDILGFMAAIAAYAFSMFVRMQYSMLGLGTPQGD